MTFHPAFWANIITFTVIANQSADRFAISLL